MNIINIKTILIIIISLTLFNCTKSATQNTDTNAEKEDKIIAQNGRISISKEAFENEDLSMTSLVKEPVGSGISSTGVIDVPPNGRAVVSAHIGGYVKKSPLLIGDQVEKGQLLLTIENIEFLELQQAYLEASEQLKFLKSDYDRQQELYDEKISSEKSFLKAESDYKRTFATFTGLKKKLELLHIDPSQVALGNFTSVSKIYAPISGDVTEINVKTGSYISSSDEIMEIVNTDHLHLELKIFEKDMLDIKRGQTVYFNLPESGVEQYKGKVHLIGKSIGKDRTVKVHAHIDASDESGFIPGMFVQATIITGDSSGVGILQEAVTEIDNQAFVMLLQSEDKDNYIFEKIVVELGEPYKGIILIENEDHLDLNGKYLVGGSYLLDSE